MSDTEIVAVGNKRLTRLTSAPHELEAGIIVAVLDQHGIQSTMTGVATAGFRARAPGWVHVLVAEEDLPRARGLLEDVRRERDDIDWGEVDVGEPDDTSLPDSTPWWLSFTLWRRIAYVIVVAYLLWLAANLVVFGFGLLLRAVGL